MTQASTEPGNTVTPGEMTLRSRLLLRLGGLALVLLLSLLLHLDILPVGENLRLLLAGITLLAGVAVLVSVLGLVQSNLLGPLAQVRNWARKVRQGRYTDPIPQPPYSGFAELADDLNSIGTRISGNRLPLRPGPAEPSLDDEALRILYEIVASINTAHNLDDLLTRFLYTLKRFTRAHAAAIWIENKQGQTELSACSGIDDALFTPGRHEVSRCLYERAATEGKIWVEQTLDKCEKIAGKRFFDSAGIGLVSVPMRYRGNVTGVINLFMAERELAQIETLKPLLASIAHHLGIAIERFHSDDETREHLINEERTRIAHELHDSLAQSMASLRFQVRVLDETMHQGDESTTWQQLERIENSLDEANTELRALIANFRAPSFKRGLVEGIEQMVSRFRNETRINTYLQKNCSARTFPKETEVQILRIIQEALWNIRKHSKAKTVRILLRDNEGQDCHILIEDDGVGINKKVYGSPGEHVGLTIMQERAAKIGGKLRIESEPGEGTRIVLEFSNPDTGICKT